MQTNNWELFCDVCGERIVRLKYGWVEWLEPVNPYLPDAEKPPVIGPRIVHFRECSMAQRQWRQASPWDRRKHALCDLQLTEFVGKRGALQFTFMWIAGVVPEAQLLNVTRRLDITLHHIEQTIYDRIELLKEQFSSDLIEQACVRLRMRLEEEHFEMAWDSGIELIGHPY